jgi:Glycosyl hydrolase family 46
MASSSKDILDIISALTPLIIGILVTGVGAFFTHIYNFRQLQLNQIAALDKLRPLLTVQNPQDREFAYSSFVALGYEELAIRLIEIQRDQTGRSVLTQLKSTGPSGTREKAAAALQTLDEAQRLVNIFEFGKPEGNEELLKEDPTLVAAFDKTWKWAEDTARELRISSKLGSAILYDTATHIGTSRARKLQEVTSKVVAPPLGSRDKEKAWLSEYLDQRDQAMQQGPAAQFYPAIKKRIDKLRDLLEMGDWDLSTVQKPSQEIVNK